MTLVVARANRAGICILSDTRITDESATRPHPGMLKSVIVNVSQCVCFADSAGRCAVAIKHIFEKGLDTLLSDDAILELLLEEHREAPAAVEFLLASQVGPVPTLHSVQAGRVERNIGSFWIGDECAFREYQREYLSVSSAESNDSRAALSRMPDAFLRAVAGKHDWARVGDFIVGVHTAKGGLKYFSRSLSTLPWNTQSDSAEWAPLEMGNAAQGAYTYSVLCPDVCGVALVAIYLSQGRFGRVFFPKEFDSPIEVPSDTAEEFAHSVEKRFGVRVTGLVNDDAGLRRV